MAKIAFIGAGSLGFTRGLTRDVLTSPLLEDATLSLMDIDAERLEFARKSVQRIVDMGNYSAKVEAALTGGPHLVLQAAIYDPVTAAVLSLAEIKQMVGEMPQRNRDYLPQFEHFEV